MILADDVLAWLKEQADAQHRAEMLSRYGIPNVRAFGVPMGVLKKKAKALGSDQALAEALWLTGWYEARVIAVHVAVPEACTESLLDTWVRDFDSWAICDTACFSLFDRTAFAWDKVAPWAADEAEFVRRAGYALIWSLSVHDKAASDERFLSALQLILSHPEDDRPLVKKAVDMALRAVGKRNRALNAQAVQVAEALAGDESPHRAWVGRKALRELTSEKVQARLPG